MKRKLSAVGNKQGEDGEQEQFGQQLADYNSQMGKASTLHSTPEDQAMSFQ